MGFSIGNKIYPDMKIKVWSNGDTMYGTYQKDGKIIETTTTYPVFMDNFSETIMLTVEYLLSEKYSNKPIQFDFDLFEKGKILVNCQSAEDSRAFLAYLHGKGLKWYGGVSLTDESHWMKYGSKTTYRCENCEISFCETDYYESQGDSIIAFDYSQL